MSKPTYVCWDRPKTSHFDSECLLFLEEASMTRTLESVISGVLLPFVCHLFLLPVCPFYRIVAIWAPEWFQTSTFGKCETEIKEEE